MNVLSYLPSTQFVSIAGSVALAGVLVWGAHTVTRPPAPATLAPAGTAAAEDWQSALAEVQLNAAVPELEGAPEAAAVLREAAKSSNITSTVGRSLFINLTDAQAQGLGADIPTQERLVAEALRQVNSASAAPQYASADLHIVNSSGEVLHSYGNALARALVARPAASLTDLYAALGPALDNGDAAAIAKLAVIARAYGAVGSDLTELSVPATVAPLHLKLANNYAGMSASIDEMRLLAEDPLRSAAAMQKFGLLQDEALRVLTNIAQQFSKGGILFTKDEPGSTWSVFLSAYTP